MELREHNRKAYDNSNKMYAEGKKRVAIVHPTGTGKSYIAMQLIEDNPMKKIAVVSPTNIIIDQYIDTLKENNIDFSNVEFLTYQELMMKNESKIKQYDHIILDEFHHCGAKEWGKGIKRLLDANKESRVLGLSATPIRYLDNLRDMAEEVFEGNIASEISLAEALLDGLLEMPIYHQGIQNKEAIIEDLKIKTARLGYKEESDNINKELDKIKDSVSLMDSTKDILEKGIPEDRKAGKYIIFCRNIKDMHKAMRKANEWFKNINEVEMYSVASQDVNGRTISRVQNAEEKRLFEDSKSDKIKLMFSVDMLSEGIHVKNVDGIIMLRGTKSPTKFKQELGRVLSIGGKKNPLVFDFTDSISSSRYIYELYHEMKDIIDKRKEDGRDTSREETTLGRFEINDYVKELSELVDELDETRLWIKNYNILKDYINSNEEIKEYFEKTGGIPASTVIEIDGRKIKIGHWLSSQKNFMKKYQGMTLEEIKSNKEIPEKDKEKMILLLELGVSYIQQRETQKIWRRNFKGFMQYVESSEEIKKKFEETGNIDSNTIIEIDGESINMDSWLANQKTFMSLYRGMTIEEIKSDKTIPASDKERMIKLIKAGVKYRKEQEMTADEIFEETMEALDKYIESSEKIREEFKRTGKIGSTVEVKVNGKVIKLGSRFTDIRKFMNQYNGMTIEEIQADKEMPERHKKRLTILIEKGVSYPEVKEHSDDEVWRETISKIAENIDNLPKNDKKYFERKRSSKKQNDYRCFWTRG
ncbi:MAG: DEAD/DEAH box helicase family protein [Clostridia bacterium]|nr:DEAD/DEAH box helicase family protein [Clostridia bacterium]